MGTTSFDIILETDRLAGKIYRYYIDKAKLPEEAARKMIEWHFKMAFQFFDPELVDYALTLNPESAAALSEDSTFNCAE